MKYHVYIYDKFSGFLNVYQSLYERAIQCIKTDSGPNKLLLENAKLSLYNGKN